MKVSLADNGFFTEILALLKLEKYGKTPNAPKVYSWFISDQLPPEDGDWKKVNQIITSSSQFAKVNHTKDGIRLYGYVVMENAEGGTLASFFQHYIEKVPSISYSWYTIDILLFQLVFSVAALPHCGLLHRDLGGSNNILISFVPESNHPEDYDWWFAVGDLKFCFPRPTFKPIMIDYGTAKHLIPKQSLKTDFRYTTLRYRAPELIFISDTCKGPLQPWYTTTTDLFSVGMSILEIIFGEFCKHDSSVDDAYACHPFMKYNSPRELPKKIEELYDSLISIENDESAPKDKRYWSRFLRRGFIDKNESKLLARYLWGMYHELGIPNNDIWPGIEDTHIWRLMDDFIADRKRKGGQVPSVEGRLFKFSKFNHHNGPPSKQAHALPEYLSDQQIFVLKDILQFNPKRRPDVITILQSDIFQHLRAKNPPSAQIKWAIPAKNLCTWPSL